MLLELDQDQTLVGSFIGTAGAAYPLPHAGPASQALNPAGASLLTWEEATPTTPSPQLWALISN